MIVPMMCKVLVKPDPVLTHSPGGIELPFAHVEREILGQTEGEVVSIGPGCFDELPACPRIGERVIFARYSGQLCKDGDVQYRLINDKDIVAARRNA